MESFYTRNTSAVKRAQNGSSLCKPFHLHALQRRRLYGLSVTLKDIAKRLMVEHPGTKPASLAKKDVVIAYIVEIVTGKQ